MDASSSDSKYHVVLFPFMSKGHTIPLLHLARLFLRRPNFIVTVFTTSGNRSFIANSLSDTTAFIIDLPFPQNVPQIPAGVESTDKLPSMSLFAPFALSTKLMQPDFEKAIETLPRVNFMVSDGFLWWTLDSAIKFGFPRLVSFGMSIYSSCLSKVVVEHRLLFGPESDDELITLPQFPWIKVTRNDFGSTFRDPEPSGPHFEFIIATITAAVNSYGTIINSFYELEATFADYWNKENGNTTWFVGPLCLADAPRLEHETRKKPTWIKWLDQKLEQGRSVLYVAFGSQVDISPQQLKEIAIGLKKSKVNFLWVMKAKDPEFGDESELEESIGDGGIIVREWVDQREILMHQSVNGFLSHCGWNSVLESICAGVPILAWPMMADQPLNARMVVEEIKVGLRVETCNGSVGGFVKWEGLKKMVKELMEGETGKEVRKNAEEYGEIAKKAMEEGSGSSRRNLDVLVDALCNPRNP
ncbi:UDP-glycosyltransferase 90A1-like [Populus alba x Populus x berolinensis]|nr:UDP-glycosyltransferase 90A1-like [Populus alba x Populus x berolinensis]